MRGIKLNWIPAVRWLRGSALNFLVTGANVEFLRLRMPKNQLGLNMIAMGVKPICK